MMKKNEKGSQYEVQNQTLQLSSFNASRGERDERHRVNVRTRCIACFKAIYEGILDRNGLKN